MGHHSRRWTSAFALAIAGLIVGAQALAAPDAARHHFPMAGNSEDLRGVAGTSAVDVWAVGDSYDGARTNTLIEHWDGTSWVQVPSPSPGGDLGSHLNGIAA